MSLRCEKGDDVEGVPPAIIWRSRRSVIEADPGSPVAAACGAPATLSALELGKLLMGGRVQQLSQHYNISPGVHDECPPVAFADLVLRCIPVDELWSVVRLALNQLTTAHVDHLGAQHAPHTSSTGGVAGSSRTDFWLVPALYPLRFRHWDLQQRMLSYFVNFPLPTVATSSNQVFVSVFIDSYEALGGDAEFAFWLLLSLVVPQEAGHRQKGRDDRQRASLGSVWRSMWHLRELEPLLGWANRPEPEVESLYDAHLFVVSGKASADDDANRRRVAWLLLADLAARGAYSASVLFEAMARHPKGVGESHVSLIWIQYFKSLTIQVTQCNRRVRWQHKSRGMHHFDDDAISNAAQTKSMHTGEGTQRVAVADDVLTFVGSLFEPPSSRGPFPDAANAMTTELLVDDGMCPSLNIDMESGYLVDPLPSRQRVIRSFVGAFCLRTGLDIFSNQHAHHITLSQQLHSTIMQPSLCLATRIGDFHLSLVLHKVGLSRDVADYIVGYMVHVVPPSPKHAAVRLFLQDYSRKELPKVYQMLQLTI